VCERQEVGKGITEYEGPPVIAIVDYGAGNLTSVAKALRHLGATCEITADPAVVAACDSVVLPGVGHFASTEIIGQRGLTKAIRDVIGSSKPFLGICVGLQWAFAGSAEAPGIAGLGIFGATCERFPAGARVPHVGWNQLEITRPSRLLGGIQNSSHVYYTHSYFAPIVEETIATTEYGCSFTAAVERRNTFAVQFHPEKSGETGLRILRNFLRLAC